MGEAYVAVGDDVQSIAWNPAGLARLNQKQVTFMHSEWFQGISYESLGYAQPLGGFLFVGGAIDRVDSGSIQKTRFTDSAGTTGGPENFGFESIGTFSVSTYVLTAAGAVDVSGLRWIPIPNLQAGMNLRVFLEKIDVASTVSAVMDLGGLWTPEALPNFTGALVAQNLGPTVSGSIPPITFRGGAAYRWMNRSLVTALDVLWAVDSGPRVSGGAEFWYKNLIAMRGGYRFEGSDPNELDGGFLGGLSLGTGFRYQIVQVDYAFASLGFLGAAHRLSLTVSF